MSKPSSLGSGAFEGIKSLLNAGSCNCKDVTELQMKDGSMEADGMECAL